MKKCKKRWEVLSCTRCLLPSTFLYTLGAVHAQRPIKTHGETVCKKILSLCEMEGGEECIH